jgi:hypothetical protein
MSIDRMKLFEFYLVAREKVVSMGYADEIDWQDSRDFSKLTESEFLREGAWVILSSGMREAIIRQRFPMISKAFLDWKSADLISRNRGICETNGVKVYNNRRKISAIGSLCERVCNLGFDRILESISRSGVQFLQQFDFIGSVTRYHLAKNIGLDVVKPDRHLERLANAAKFSSPTELCQRITDITGDKLSVVDLVLWRYCTINNQYAIIP